MRKAEEALADSYESVSRTGCAVPGKPWPSESAISNCIHGTMQVSETVTYLKQKHDELRSTRSSLKSALSQVLRPT